MTQSFTIQIPCEIDLRGDMRAARIAILSKKGAHGGNMVSPVKPSRRRR